MKNSHLTLPLQLLLPALLTVSAACAEPAQTTRDTELQAQAQADAATLATLPQNTQVDVLRRSGAWSEIKTATGQTGWVRMLSLKLEGAGAVPSVAASGTANPIGALGNLLVSGRSSNSATVTTGVRGLTEEDLKNAQANPSELEKMKKFAIGKTAAQTFAQRTKVTPTRIEYLLDSPSSTRYESPRKEGD